MTKTLLNDTSQTSDGLTRTSKITDGHSSRFTVGVFLQKKRKGAESKIIKIKKKIANNDRLLL